MDLRSLLVFLAIGLVAGSSLRLSSAEGLSPLSDHGRYRCVRRGFLFNALGISIGGSPLFRRLSHRLLVPSLLYCWHGLIA